MIVDQVTEKFQNLGGLYGLIPIRYDPQWEKIVRSVYYLPVGYIDFISELVDPGLRLVER